MRVLLCDAKPCSDNGNVHPGTIVVECGVWCHRWVVPIIKRILRERRGLEFSRPRFLRSTIHALRLLHRDPFSESDIDSDVWAIIDAN